MFGRRCSGWPFSTTPLAERALKLVAKTRSRRPARDPSARDRATSSHAFSEPDRKQRALGPGPPPGFVPRPVNERLEQHALAHVQRADALRRVELVAGDRQQIDAELVHVDRRSCRPTAPRRCGSERRARARCAAHGRDRLDRADLVVGVHDADQDGARRDRLAEDLRDRPAPSDRREDRSRCAPSFSRNRHGSRMAGCSMAVVMM